MRRNGTIAVIAVLLALVAGCGGAEDPSGGAGIVQRNLGDTATSTALVGAASLGFTSATVAGGDSIVGTVTLSGTSQSASGGVVVYLSFDARLLAGPRFVRVLNGQSSARFTLYANPFVATATSAAVNANTSTPDAAVYLTQALSITPSPASPAGTVPQVASLSVTPSSVTSGTPASGTLTLTAPAPASGAAVQVSIPNDFFDAGADVPAVVLVPAGATAATFTVRTHLSSGATSTTENVVASFFGGPFQGASLVIAAGSTSTSTTSSTSTPTGTGTAVSSCTAGQSSVTLSVGGSAGSVTSGPSSLDVSSGASATACFSSNTRVELFATRRADWSGVTCDGGNSGQDRCRFTTGSAAVAVSATLQ